MYIPTRNAKRSTNPIRISIPRRIVAPPSLKSDEGFGANLKSLKSELDELQESAESHDTPGLGTELTVGDSPKKPKKACRQAAGMSSDITAHLGAVNVLLPGKAGCDHVENTCTEMLNPIKKWAESTDLSKSAGSPLSSRPVPSRTKASDSDAEIKPSYRAWICSCESLQRSWEGDLKVLENTCKKSVERDPNLDGVTLCGTSPEEPTDNGVAS